MTQVVDTSAGGFSYPIVSDPDVGITPDSFIPDPRKFLGRITGIYQGVQCVKGVLGHGSFLGNLYNCGTSILGLIF